MRLRTCMRFAFACIARIKPVRTSNCTQCQCVSHTVTLVAFAFYIIIIIYIAHQSRCRRKLMYKKTKQKKTKKKLRGGYSNYHVISIRINGVAQSSTNMTDNRRTKTILREICFSVLRTEESIIPNGRITQSAWSLEYKTHNRGRGRPSLEKKSRRSRQNYINNAGETGSEMENTSMRIARKLPNTTYGCIAIDTDIQSNIGFVLFFKIRHTGL